MNSNIARTNNMGRQERLMELLGRGARRGITGPKMRDLSPAGLQVVGELLVLLGGQLQEGHLTPGRWDMSLDDGTVIELDEENHFNRYRQLTLSLDYAKGLPWSSAYREYSIDNEHKAGSSAGFWCPPPNKLGSAPKAVRLSGAAAQPGDFSGNGSPRWKLRSLYDAIRDIFALEKPDFALARLSIYDDVGGIELGGALERGELVDAGELRDLIRKRTLVSS